MLLSSLPFLIAVISPAIADGLTRPPQRQGVVATCGAANNNAVCGEGYPCCSEYNVCGLSAEHCGGGCQSTFSYSIDPKAASCYADREENGRRCISGYYNFTSSTWLQNEEAYNGNPETADFTVKNVQYIKNTTPSGLTLLLAAPDAAGQPGKSSRISSTAYMLYGKFTARLLSGSVPGMVTAFISMSDEKDEIDFEWVGKDLQQVQTNFFAKGVIDYTKSTAVNLNASTATTVFEYTVDWSADRIIWSVNGKAVRTLNKADVTGNASFPNTPSRIQFSVWDGGAGAEGTRNWAGGAIDWSKAGPNQTFTALFESVTIQCNGDPVPTGPPARKSTVTPTLNDSPISVSVPGQPGYNGNSVSPNAASASMTFSLWTVVFCLFMVLF